MSAARPSFVRIAALSFVSANSGSIGMPVVVTFSGGMPSSIKCSARLVERDEVVLVVVAEPHRVNVEVGDDDHLRAVRALCFAFIHETISAGRKCVQTIRSGRSRSSIFTNGRVLSLSHASRRRSFCHGLSSAS